MDFSPDPPLNQYILFYWVSYKPHPYTWSSRIPVSCLYWRINESLVGKNLEDLTLTQYRNSHFEHPELLVWRRQWQPTPAFLPGKIPWMEEPGGLQAMGSLRVRHDWATSLSLFTFMHWRRKWQPTPVFLPEESQRWGSLVGCRLWGRTESGTTEAT